MNNVKKRIELYNKVLQKTAVVDAKTTFTDSGVVGPVSDYYLSVDEKMGMQTLISLMQQNIQNAYAIFNEKPNILPGSNIAEILRNESYRNENMPQTITRNVAVDLLTKLSPYLPQQYKNIYLELLRDLKSAKKFKQETYKI